MKRTFRNVAGASVAALALVAAGCGGDDGGDDGAITIGVIAPITGSFGEIGDNIVGGFELAVQHAQDDGLAAELDVQVEVKDEQANAEAATQAARDFLNDDVELLAGMLTTPACSAVAPVVEQAGGVLVGSVCAGNELSGAYTGSAPHERTFMSAPRDSMVSTALAQVIAEKYGDVTEYSVFGYDYGWGHDTWEVYRDGLSAGGVGVATTQEYWVPLGESNFRTQVSALSRGLGEPGTGAVFLSTYGAGTTAFLQQAQAFDVTDQVELLVGAGGYYPVARQLEGDAPDMWNAYDYMYGAFDNEVNERFVADYEAEHGTKPVSWSYEGYQAGLAYMTAIDEVGSGDPDAIRDALTQIEFDGPSGAVAMDPDTHQLMAPVVVSHTRGNADAPETVEILETVVVPATDALKQG